MGKEVNSIEDLVTGGEQDLKTLVATGNSVAEEWLEKLQATSSAIEKLSMFGDMKVTLIQDARAEAKIVLKEMFQS